MTKQQVIELMESYGYTAVAESTGTQGKFVFFSKEINGIRLAAKVDIEKESLAISPGILKYGCRIVSEIYKIPHSEFEKLEKTAYLYGLICHHIDVAVESEESIEHLVPDLINKVKQETVKTPRKTIDDRKAEFWEDVKKIGKGTYSKKMCQEFFDYWTAVNKGGTKMAFEKQQTFDISRRLATWAKNEIEFKPAWKQRQEDKVEQQNEEATKIKQPIDTKKLFG